MLSDHADAAARPTQRDASGIVSSVASALDHRNALLEHDEHASM